MKVIFLDIDGVMNSSVFYERRYKRRWLQPITYWYKFKTYFKYIFNGFKHKGISTCDYKSPKNYDKFSYKFNRLKKETDPQKWEWLSETCNDGDYKICISSVWKNHFKNINDWRDALVKLGFKDDIFVGITGKMKELRGEEIKEWIGIAEDSYKETIENYIILDDDSDMLPEQLNNFFHIDGYYGMSPNTTYKIDRHFKNL
jgi:hypothetical protein